MNPEREKMTQQTRLTMSEFLSQLDIAPTWMIWINPMLEEIELVVKDLDGRMTAFHGPHPATVDSYEYRKFCTEVEILSENK